MKILKLTIKKEYFDKIKSGKKKVEYRWFKKYWNQRLMNKDGSIKNFDAVEFKNGYSSDSPKVLVSCKGIGFAMAKSPLGKGMQWLIGLGDIID